MAAAAPSVASPSALDLGGGPTGYMTTHGLAAGERGTTGEGESGANHSASSASASAAAADRLGLNALHTSICSAAAIHASACTATGESEGRAMQALVEAVRRLDPSSPIPSTLDEDIADAKSGGGEDAADGGGEVPAAATQESSTAAPPPLNEDDKMREYVQSLLQQSRGGGGKGRAVEDDDGKELDEDPVAAALREARQSAEMFRIRSCEKEKKEDEKKKKAGSDSDNDSSGGDALELSLAPEGQNPARAALSYLSSSGLAARKRQNGAEPTALELAKAHAMKAKAAVASAKAQHHRTAANTAPSTRSQSSCDTGGNATSGGDAAAAAKKTISSSPRVDTEEATSAAKEGAAAAEANTPSTQSPSSYGTGSHPSDGGSGSDDAAVAAKAIAARAPPKIVEGDDFEALEMVTPLSPRVSRLPRSQLVEPVVEAAAQEAKMSAETNALRGRYSFDVTNSEVEATFSTVSPVPRQQEPTAPPSPSANPLPPVSPQPSPPRPTASPQSSSAGHSIPSNEPPRYHVHDEDEHRHASVGSHQGEGIERPLEHGIQTVVADAQSGFESLTASHESGSSSSISTFDPDNGDGMMNDDEDSVKRMEAFRRDAEEDAAKRRMTTTKAEEDAAAKPRRTRTRMTAVEEAKIKVKGGLDPVEAARLGGGEEEEAHRPSIDPHNEALVSSPVRAEAKARADMARAAMAHATKKRRERRKKADHASVRPAIITADGNGPPVDVVEVPSPRVSSGGGADDATGGGDTSNEGWGREAEASDRGAPARDEKLSGRVSPRNWANVDSFGLANRDCDDSVSVGDRYAPLGVRSDESKEAAGGNGDEAVENAPPVEVKNRHNNYAESDERAASGWEGEIAPPTADMGSKDEPQRNKYGSAGLSPQRRHTAKMEEYASGSGSTCRQEEGSSSPLPLGTTAPTVRNGEKSASSGDNSSGKGYQFLPDAFRSWLG